MLVKKVLNLNLKGYEVIVPGLMSIGEAACVSVHGANRLGANSLLDIVVFGKACSENIYDINKPGEIIEKCNDNDVNNMIETYENLLNREGTKNVGEVRLELQKIMQKHAGVFRNDVLLKEGCDKINKNYNV